MISHFFFQPRRYIADKKREDGAAEKSVVEPDVSDTTEAMSHRIDECIKSVCTAVQKIYERDFMVILKFCFGISVFELDAKV